MFLYVGGALLSFVIILRQIPGGWAHVAVVAGAADKFRVFDFRFSFTSEFFARNYSFWAGLIGGCFLTTASHGTEQLMVQRYLAAPSERDARKALFSSWLVIFFQFALFLLIGAMLFVHYGDQHLAAPKPIDTIYPAFIWNNLPPGVAGLVIAAILAAGMSNLSAALNALASTSIMDFYRPLFRGVDHSDAHFLKIARWATVAWGVILFAIGLVARHWGSVLEAGLSIASVLYGSLLGVFFLGLLTRRVGQNAAMVAMIFGLLLMLYIKLYTGIAFTWWVPIGTIATFSVGLALSYVMKERESA
jgi:Na+/proline symporter